MSSHKFSDILIEALRAEGYTHCYFVAGGNIMHLLNSVRGVCTCIPFAHEVGAAIATEYHNASLREPVGKAFCLVTAGPGLTNVVTAIAGAWQESRDLLVIGGQVKTSDLAGPALRQRGIQEVDGVTLTSSITKSSLRLMASRDLAVAIQAVRQGATPRKGPVFLEIPLDIQATDCEEEPSLLADLISSPVPSLPQITAEQAERLRSQICTARRPVILIGGGVSYSCSRIYATAMADSSLPLMTTYNGADRVASNAPNYFGRPNTWGMRYSNILIQQADLVVAIGTRLGLQQTGFNWQQFVPEGQIIHVDIDPSELHKGHPYVDESLAVDADGVLQALFEGEGIGLQPHQQEWLTFCKQVKAELPLSEACNTSRAGFVNPYDFYLQLSELMPGNSFLIPCSSGSSFTSSYQSVLLADGCRMLSNKSQAAMGYGLSGAIGTALANMNSRVFLVEGDGGFLQNIQELAVAKKNNLRIGIFLWVNNGYASIRMTQQTYFNGAWLGCDEESGLGFPNWEALFESFAIPFMSMTSAGFHDPVLQGFMADHLLYAVLVPIDPQQTFFPKISSRITAAGGMVSNPLHLIGPPLPPDLYAKLTPYLPASET